MEPPELTQSQDKQDTKQTLNISSSQNDPFFRYKMPSLEVKHEGPGKKTVITNIDAISKALKHPTTVLVAHFKCQGTNAVYDDKTSKLVIAGHKTGEELQKQLQAYIEKYVLCPSQKCRLPETVVTISKGMIGVSCNACGFVGQIKGSEKIVKIFKQLQPKQKEKEKDDDLQQL